MKYSLRALSGVLLIGLILCCVTCPCYTMYSGRSDEVIVTVTDQTTGDPIAGALIGFGEHDDSSRTDEHGKLRRLVGRRVVQYGALARHSVYLEEIVMEVRAVGYVTRTVHFGRVDETVDESQPPAYFMHPSTYRIDVEMTPREM
ncbi:hypothetical protein AB1K70_01385 [Bremerella sp. JC770]|uniref:hypothetical protein n=1 Tax=Bremerella sp. JC770 TaxID=3232137 RepID=UPI003458AF99